MAYRSLTVGHVPADPELGATEAGPAVDIAPLELAHIPVDQPVQAAVDAEHRVAAVQPEPHRGRGGGVHTRRQPTDVDQGDPVGAALGPVAGQRGEIEWKTWIISV